MTKAEAESIFGEFSSLKEFQKQASAINLGDDTITVTTIIEDAFTAIKKLPQNQRLGGLKALIDTQLAAYFSVNALKLYLQRSAELLSLFDNEKDKLEAVKIALDFNPQNVLQIDIISQNTRAETAILNAKIFTCHFATNDENLAKVQQIWESTQAVEMTNQRITERKDPQAAIENNPALLFR